MKPMLAGSPNSFDDIKFPVMASSKLDGVRCLIQNGKLVSRNLKEFPNLKLQQKFAGLPEGLDGELIEGLPNEDPFRRTTSAVMSEDADVSEVRYYIFDLVTPQPYVDRYTHLFTLKNTRLIANDAVIIVGHLQVNNAGELRTYFRAQTSMGFEGVMVRSLTGPYKQGRSTVKEGYLLKIKEFKDAEAVITGFEERMHNSNTAKKNALGRTERSTHKAGLVGRGDLGALIVRGINGEYQDVEFNIGTGFDDDERRHIWSGRDRYVGKIVKFTYFPTGAKDRPRFPVFAGFRDSRDI